MLRRVFIGIGSNLGDRLAYLQLAVDGLPDVVAVSAVYETEPVGFADQGPFLNAVVELVTDVSAQSLLAIANDLEQAARRIRTIVNGPRTLDVDILWIEDEQVDAPDLVVPHPRMWERQFVLQPLADLAPELMPADWTADIPPFTESLRLPLS